MEQLKQDHAQDQSVHGSITGDRLRLETEINDKFYDMDKSTIIPSVLFDRTQEDLSSYKKRIDENAERQRQHADIMADLQRKVEEYRRHFSSMESRISERKMVTESYTVDMSDAKLRDEIWGGKFKFVDNMNEDEWSTQLLHERKRNEELISQLEDERLHVSRLHNEMQRLRKHFEMSIRDKERIYVNRERSFAQHLSDEQRKIMDLWSELKQIRKQCTEYREQTEHDLENQRNEFIKTMRNVTGVVNEMHQSGNEGAERSHVDIFKDTTLIETMRRSEGHDLSLGLPQIIRELRLARADTGLKPDVLKKYEESLVRVGELEVKDDESRSRLLSLESELKSTRERFNDSQDALRRLYDLAREFEHGPDSKKRTRSFSPAKGYLPPSEVVRTVRYVMSTRTNDSLVLQRKLNNAEAEIKELINQYKASDAASKKLVKQFADTKDDLNNNYEEIAKLRQSMKDAECHIKNLETDKMNANNNRRRLEEEIRRLNDQFKNTLNDIELKTRDEGEDRKRLVESEYGARITELKRKNDMLLDENKNLKEEIAEFDKKYRSINVDYKTLQQKISDRDSEFKVLQDAKLALTKQLNDEKSRLNSVTNEINNIRKNYDSSSKSSENHVVTVNELKQRCSNIGKERDNVAQELADFKRSFDDTIRERDDARKICQRQLADIDRLKNELNNVQKDLADAHRKNDELDTQLNTSKAKLTSLETSLQSSNKDREKMSEINQKLIKEKTEIIALVKTNEMDVQSNMDTVKKLEQEVEKLRAELLLADDRERRVNEAYKEQTNLARSIQSELDDLRAELDNIQKLSIRTDAESSVEKAVAVSEEPSSIGIQISTTKLGNKTYSQQTTIHDITNAQMKDAEMKWKHVVDKIRDEKDDLARYAETLRDELSEREEELKRRDLDLDNLRKRFGEQVEKVRLETTTMHNKYKTDYDEDRNKYNQNVDLLRLEADELRSKLKSAEDKLAGMQGKDGQLDREINEWKEKFNKISEQLANARSQLQSVEENADKEIRRLENDLFSLRNDLKTFGADNEALKSQIVGTEENNKSLSKTITDQDAKLRDTNSHIHRLMEEMDELKKMRDLYENDLQSTTDRIRSIETDFEQMELDRNNKRSQLESAWKDVDILKNSNSFYETEIAKLNKKLQQVTNELTDRANDMEQLKFEREQMQTAYRAKTKLVETLNHELQALDAKQNRLRTDFNDTSDKLATSDSERDSLRLQLDKLHQMLQFTKEQLVRKTSEYQAALDEVANAHRLAEDGRVNAVHELEYAKLELGDLKSRMEKTDQYTVTVQQNYVRSEAERERLGDALRRFQFIVNRAITIKRFQQVVDDSKQEKAPESVQAVQAEKGTTDQFDVSGFDSNLNSLLTRIEKLEQEKNDYQNALERLKRKTGDTTVTVNKQETFIRSDTRETSAMQALELRLESLKQIINSQEEALNERDEEKQNMRSKIVELEMQMRSKEGQIRHLNDLVKSLRGDINATQTELRLMQDHEEEWNACKFHIESKMKDFEAENKKISMLTTNFDTDRTDLSEKVNKLTIELQENQSQFEDLERETNRLKKELEKADKLENEQRTNANQLSRFMKDNEMLRDQLVCAENELSCLNSRKVQLENELMLARSEMRECKQRTSDSVYRISELQRQLEDVQGDKKRLNDRILGFEKTVTSYRNTEADLRQQISASANARNALQNELSDLQRRLSQVENEKRLLSEQNEEFEQQRNSLFQKIASLERDKRAIEALMTNSALQRESIEQSLNALERENKELHRSCSQLQQQIANLELENGNRLLSLVDKQKEEHEKLVTMVMSEKSQVEHMIENRERGFKSRIKQLETQLSALREQLFEERRKYRDFSERMLNSDMNKVTMYGGAVSNIYDRSSFIYSDTLDSARFPSYDCYDSPWIDMPIPGSEYTKSGSTVITLKENTTAYHGFGDNKLEGFKDSGQSGRHGYEILKKEESDSSKPKEITEESIVLKPTTQFKESDYDVRQK